MVAAILILDESWEIECIYDTRKRDANFKPIPGSGDPVSCDCCQKTIEVHAYVNKRDRTERAVVGTQCCKKANLRNGCVEATNKSWWKIKTA